MLKTGTKITDLIEKSNHRRERYTVETKDAVKAYIMPEKVPFDKKRINIRPAAHNATAI